MPWLRLQFRLYLGTPAQIPSLSWNSTDFRAFTQNLPCSTTPSHLMAIHTEQDDWATLQAKLKRTFGLHEGISLTLISVPPTEGAIVTSMEILHTMDKEDVIYVIAQPARKVELNLLPSIPQAYQPAVGVNHLQQAVSIALATPDNGSGKKKRKQGSHTARKARKVSAYSLFKLDFWKLHQSEPLTDAAAQSFSEISKACGAKWKELDVESRAKYEKQAQQAGELGTVQALQENDVDPPELHEEDKEDDKLGATSAPPEICQV